MTHLAWLPARSALAAVLATACAVTGCTEPDADEDVVVDEASLALAASLDLVGILDSFEVSEALALVPVGLARARILLDVRAALLASVANRLCVDVQVVDSDTESSVAVTYDRCPAGLLRLIEVDGSLRARLEIETAPCGAAECPSAVRFTLDTEYLRIGSRFGTFFTEMQGRWSLCDPLAPGMATTWDSEYSVRNHLERGLSLRSRASWLVEGLCVTFDVDAELQVQRRQDLQTVAASAREVVQCLNECPSAGVVQLAYGRGKILGWEYTGMDTALVTGPRGRRFEIALPCGEE
jgi:hypothetical protein